MHSIKTRLDNNGRLFIPASYRQALHLKAGSELILKFVEGELRITSLKDKIQKARDLISKHNVHNLDLVNELFKLRKLDQTHE